jgi:Low affinity iron permease
MAEQKAKLFDRFAEASAGFVSRTPFFVACVLLVVLWAPSFWLFPSVDTWQLVINTATTIITFLMVALLQNSQHRAEQAIHQKLDALADGLADFMEHLGGDHPGFARDIDDLRRAVGVEKEMVMPFPMAGPWISGLAQLERRSATCQNARAACHRPVGAPHMLVDWKGPPFGGAAQDGAHARRPRDLAFSGPLRTRRQDHGPLIEDRSRERP